MNSGAIFSDDRWFRIRLWRQWDASRRTLLWLLLNPSIAAEMDNDPTALKVVHFSKMWGFGGAEIQNLYGFIATSPADLKRQGYLVGAGVYEALKVACLEEPGRPVLCGWGANAQPNRAHDVMWDLAAYGAKPHVLGFNKDGSPKHPLYMRNDSLLVPWELKLW